MSEQFVNGAPADPKPARDGPDIQEKGGLHGTTSCPKGAKKTLAGRPECEAPGCRAASNARHGL